MHKVNRKCDSKDNLKTILNSDTRIKIKTGK